MIPKIALFVIFVAGLFIFASGCMEKSGFSTVSEVPLNDIQDNNTSLDGESFNATAGIALAKNDSTPQTSNMTTVKLERPPFAE